MPDQQFSWDAILNPQGGRWASPPAPSSSQPMLSDPPIFSMLRRQGNQEQIGSPERCGAARFSGNGTHASSLSLCRCPYSSLKS